MAVSLKQPGMKKTSSSSGGAKKKKKKIPLVIHESTERIMSELIRKKDRAYAVLTIVSDHIVLTKTGLYAGGPDSYKDDTHLETLVCDLNSGKPCWLIFYKWKKKVGLLTFTPTKKTMAKSVSDVDYIKDSYKAAHKLLQKKYKPSMILEYHGKNKLPVKKTMKEMKTGIKKDEDSAVSVSDAVVSSPVESTEESTDPAKGTALSSSSSGSDGESVTSPRKKAKKSSSKSKKSSASDIGSPRGSGGSESDNEDDGVSTLTTDNVSIDSQSRQLYNELLSEKNVYFAIFNLFKGSKMIGEFKGIVDMSDGRDLEYLVSDDIDEVRKKRKRELASPLRSPKKTKKKKARKKPITLRKKELEEGDPFAMEYFVDKFNEIQSENVQPRMCVLYWKQHYLPMLFLPKSSDWRRVPGKPKEVISAWKEIVEIMQLKFQDLSQDGYFEIKGKKKLNKAKLLEKLDKVVMEMGDGSEDDAKEEEEQKHNDEGDGGGEGLIGEEDEKGEELDADGGVIGDGSDSRVEEDEAGVKVDQRDEQDDGDDHGDPPSVEKDAIEEQIPDDGGVVDPSAEEDEADLNVEDTQSSKIDDDVVDPSVAEQSDE